MTSRTRCPLTKALRVAVASLGCTLALGCSAYDRALLEAKVGPGTATGKGGARGKDASVDARAPGGPDAGAADASAFDAAAFDAGGGTMDAASTSDAGTANPDAASDAGDAAALDAADCMAAPGGDCCPNDPNKTRPGVCGCGVAETDSDGDGTPDCQDGCAMDPGKTVPGVCGCGLADVQDGCLGLRSALVHRYSFDGSGTTATDSKGTADGTIVGTTLDGSGSLALASGSTEQYVDLPNNLLSPLTDASIEVWLNWTGGNSWQRIFDFGSTNRAEGMRGTGVTYLFLTPKGGSSPTAMRFVFSTNGTGNEQVAAASADLPSSTMSHVVAVVDDTNNQLLLYRDGVQVGSTTFTSHLSQLSDVNCWLGRSLFMNDPGLSATFYEVRVYDAALSPGQIGASFTAGPDATFF